MSYISATVTEQRDRVIVWERNNDGDRVTKVFSAPYYFYVDDPDGKYTTIYDTPVRKIVCRSSGDMYEQKKQYPVEQTWEADFSPEIRVLAKHYRDAPIPDLHATFYDIEVDYDPELGFAGTRNPYAPINSMSLFHTHTNKMVVLCVPPTDKNGVRQQWTEERLRAECNNRETLPSGISYEFRLFDDESSLLDYFLLTIKDSDALVGWNSDFFDAPYIAKRLELTKGASGLEKLGFEGARAPYFTDVEVMGNVQTKVEVTGRIFADYLQLFKKYSPGERASYKLSAIEQEVDLKLPKLEYHGTLHTLYRDDFAFFVRYNIRDCEILNGFEKALGYFNVANLMYHLSCGLFQHVGGTLKLAELAITNHCHYNLKRVVNNIRQPKIDRAIAGALVLFPQIGLQEKVGSIDIRSLYPSAMMSINISPETKIGQFTTTENAVRELFLNSDVELTLRAEHGGEETTLPAKVWKQVLQQAKLSVSGYGTVFDQSKTGIIPTVLANWFDMRIQYQGLKKAAINAASEILNGRNVVDLSPSEREQYDQQIAASEYNDRLQYVFKIKLNSLYGALSNLYFRFYDLENAESVTATGRMILKHQSRKVTEILDGTYNVDFPLYETEQDAIDAGQLASVALHGPVFKGNFQSRSVIYGDTDSTYFLTHAPTIEQAIQVADAVAGEVNRSYPQFMRDMFLCQPGFDDKIKAAREVVSDRGIFVDKKRYILHLIDVDGKPVDKMKVMGLDTKKTTIPQHVSSKLNGFIESLLTGKEWDDVANEIVDYKDMLRKAPDIRDIGLPKGANKVEEYTRLYAVGGESTRLPGHIAAAIHYNQALKEYNDKVSLPITSGMKIKVFYLTSKCGKFKSIALPTDIEVVPQWFTENFTVDIDAHITRLVDNPLQNILKAIGKKTPTRQTIFMDSLLEY